MQDNIITHARLLCGLNPEMGHRKTGHRLVTSLWDPKSVSQIHSVKKSVAIRRGTQIQNWSPLGDHFHGHMGPNTEMGPKALAGAAKPSCATAHYATQEFCGF